MYNVDLNAGAAAFSARPSDAGGRGGSLIEVRACFNSTPFCLKSSSARLSAQFNLLKWRTVPPELC